MLTVITATLNAARFLDRAVASVTAQQSPTQHLVIDGGSTDGTLDIARRHAQIETVVVPGCSIYEAWNLGLDQARGDIVMFLNADDELAGGAVAAIEMAFKREPTADLVAGRAAFADADRPAEEERVLPALSGAWQIGPLVTGVPAINAVAFRPSVFARYGRFDGRYRIAGDRAFLLELALQDAPPMLVTTEALLYRYHVHPGSLTLQRSLAQRLRIARDHIDLAQAMLQRDLSPSAALWFRHMRRREAIVAALHCLASGRPGASWDFAKSLLLRRG